MRSHNEIYQASVSKHVFRGRSLNYPHNRYNVDPDSGLFFLFIIPITVPTMFSPNPATPTSDRAQEDDAQPRTRDRSDDHPDRIPKSDSEQVPKLLVNLVVRDNDKRKVGRQNDAPDNGANDSENEREDGHEL